MTPAETADILRKFNAWRRDFDDKFEQPDTREISEAIDAAVEMIERLGRMPYAIDIVWYRNGLDMLGASLSSFMADVQTELEESK